MHAWVWSALCQRFGEHSWVALAARETNSQVSCDASSAAAAGIGKHGPKLRASRVISPTRFVDPALKQSLFSCQECDANEEALALAKPPVWMCITGHDLNRAERCSFNYIPSSGQNTTGNCNPHFFVTMGCVVVTWTPGNRSACHHAGDRKQASLMVPSSGLLLRNLN